MNKTTDSRVLELFNKVREKKKSIESNERITYLTNLSFGYNESVVTDRVNIHTVTSMEKLVDIYAFLMQKKENNEKAAKALNLNISVDKWLGYKISDWMKDIESKIKQLGLTKERKELSLLEERLDALISTEQRREMELEAIEKELA